MEVEEQEEALESNESEQYSIELKHSNELLIGWLSCITIILMTPSPQTPWLAEWHTNIQWNYRLLTRVYKVTSNSSVHLQ